MAHAATDEHHGHHIIPLSLLLKVFGGLVFLTILTVYTAKYVDLGAFNIVLALLIAFTKAGLVVTFFMALKWDNRVNLLIFTLGCVFVVVFLSFTLFDTAFRGDAGNVGAETIDDQQRREDLLRAREAGEVAPATDGDHAEEGDDGH